MDVRSGKWERANTQGEPPSPRAAHAAAAVGSMVVVQVSTSTCGLRVHHYLHISHLETLRNIASCTEGEATVAHTLEAMMCLSAEGKTVRIYRAESGRQGWHQRIFMFWISPISRGLVGTGPLQSLLGLPLFPHSRRCTEQLWSYCNVCFAATLYRLHISRWSCLHDDRPGAVNLPGKQVAARSTSAGHTLLRQSWASAATLLHKALRQLALLLVYRVAVSGPGPCARYAHTLALVANRFLVAMGGNDGKQTLGDAWALDTSDKPYQWRKITDAGETPAARY